MYRDTLLAAAIPGATLGANFAANINSTPVIPKGPYLDHFVLGIKGAVSTAPVTITTALQAIATFTFKAGQETRIQLSGLDLLALHAAWYKSLPFGWQNTDNTGSTFVLGLKIPIQETIDNSLSYSFSVTYAAQTNFATPVLSLTAVYLNTAPAAKPLIVVPVPFTTPGATGTTAVGATLQNLGNLQGLLLYNTTAPDDTADKYDIQSVQLVESGKPTSILLTANPDVLFGHDGYQNADNYGKALQKYSYWDFSQEPYDVKTAFMQFTADVEITSEATRLIPIVTKS